MSQQLRKHKLLYGLLLLAVVLSATLGSAAALFILLRERAVVKHERELTPLIDDAAFRHDLSPALIKAVIWKESRFDPTCVGDKGEIGLMQLTPGAVEEWRRRNPRPKVSAKELENPALNIEIGAWYLAWTGRHWEKYASKDILQLAEYNAGYGRVSKLWLPSSPELPITLEKISFPGTRSYIKQVLERRRHYEEQMAREQALAPIAVKDEGI
ncbi:MAG: lytic transglycosylase domain-containing protein [Lentisphaerae bacterium]|nr:lytic transglycosylase domain-containing protein [Lentisphaerota bacterium]